MLTYAFGNLFPDLFIITLVYDYCGLRFKIQIKQLSSLEISIK